MMKNNVYNYQRGIQILERILCRTKASREKKLLALIGLANIAKKGMERRCGDD